MSAPTDRELPPVGEVITRIREAAGFNKSEFARRLAVTRWTVQAWERGEWPPSRANARRIAVLCGKNPGYLLQYANWDDSGDRLSSAMPGQPSGLVLTRLGGCRPPVPAAA